MVQLLHNEPGQQRPPLTLCNTDTTTHGSIASQRARAAASTTFFMKYRYDNPWFNCFTTSQGSSVHHFLYVIPIRQPMVQLLHNEPGQQRPPLPLHNTDTTTHGSIASQRAID
ncbi:hypothetical protein ISG33_07095 [Glaciecola sp. MH2013]|uniref:hypothetical protein n=1 Tax=Glaciecola sp. MH2013 TaxID=2785524 RepID=UPI00189F8D8B|nr:hypothetical protein [Glaciecola sp. MH2013]MBF7073159.1 hypothetical protein [Glaciecola sp. MH2013]